MQIYNPKEWVKAVFYAHKSDTVRKLWPYLVFAALFSWEVAYLELEYLKISEKSWVKNITVVHSLLGFALSLLLVFRTNTAYDRWWEGRKQWGTLVNASRNLARKLDAMLPDKAHLKRDFFRRIIPVYAQSLAAYLRSDYTTFMLDENEHPELELEKGKHWPNRVSSLLFRELYDLRKEKIISDADYRMLDMETRQFTEVCGACERIKNTPLPQTYTSFLKKFIVIYCLSLPTGFVFSIGYFVAVAVPFVFYVLASLELIAESIEDPFGTDSEDLPLERISANIKKHVEEIIRA
ncbi:MAG: bestrophin family protein [Leadbetterella sp.]|nr:bestrophin family protein [Leadbetterella sp.]